VRKFLAIMTKKQIIQKIKRYLENKPKDQLLNLLESWEGQTPSLFCEQSEDCSKCKFPDERVCDDQSCENRFYSKLADPWRKK